MDARVLIEKRDLSIASRFWFGFINITTITFENESILHHLKAAFLGFIISRRHIDLGIMMSEVMAIRSN